MRYAPSALLLACLLLALPALAAEPSSVGKKVNLTYNDAQKKAIAEIEKLGGIVLQISQDSAAHSVDFHLQGRDLTDASLDLLKQVPQIEQLNLAQTKITDAGLKTVAGLADLRTLHLEYTKVTDAGLASLKALGKLEYLNLVGNEGVTDAGAAKLADLKTLKSVYLWQTKVSKAAAEDLQKKVPGLRANTGAELTIVAAPAKAEEKKEGSKPDAKPAAAVAGAAVASDGTKPINDKCPVSNKPINPEKTVTYEGKLIAFCCDDCKAKFEKDPAKCAAKLFGKAPAKAAGDAGQPAKKAPAKKGEGKDKK